MYEISKNTIGVYPNFKIRKLVICVTSSHFPPWENMSFPCQLCSPSVIVSSHIYEGWHLICFVFSHLLPKCPGREISPASAMTFPKYPRGREMNECCKMLLQRPFLQLARIQWHLVVIVDTFKDGRYFYLPPSPLFFCERKIFVICLIWILKFYLTGFPVKFITNIKYL